MNWKKFFNCGISIRFKDESDDGDVNNPDVGDKETPAKTGGGSADDSSNQKKNTETKEIVVDGEKKLLTADELIKYAQLGFSSSQRYEAASKKEKNAEKGLRISGLMESLQSDNASEEDAKELALLLGLDAGEFMQYLNDDGSSVNNKPTPEKGTPAKVSKEDLAAGLKELGLDPAEVSGILNFSKQRHIDSARQEIRKISDEAVDKDEIFGKMMIGEKEKDRREVIQSMVAEDVLRKIQDGVPFGADMVATSVQKIRSHLTRFGIPSRPDLYPISLGFGPGSGLPAEVQADEPIKRVSVTDAGAEDNFVKRYMQKTIQKAREKLKH